MFHSCLESLFRENESTDSHDVNIGSRYWHTDKSFGPIFRLCASESKHFVWICLCIHVCVVSWQTHFVILLGKQHLADIWKRTMQGRSQSGGEEIPPSVCPLTVSLLSSCLQHNKTRCPLQFIAVFLMRSVGAQNFKACCRVTFFFQRQFSTSKERGFFSKRGSLIYFDNSDMHSCKNINSTK